MKTGIIIKISVFNLIRINSSLQFYLGIKLICMLEVHLAGLISEQAKYGYDFSKICAFLIFLHQQTVKENIGKPGY